MTDVLRVQTVARSVLRWTSALRVTRDITCTTTRVIRAKGYVNHVHLLTYARPVSMGISERIIPHITHVFPVQVSV